MSAGRGDEALRELEFMRPLYFETGDRMNILRLKWMEGRIYRLQGEALAAESSLREAHAGFVDAKIPYEAATVALDLAVFLAEKGRIHELKHLAADLVAVFRRLGVAREACAALMIFESVAQAEAVTVSLITRLSDYLQRVRAHPELRFEHDH